jgi:RNA polymerase-binding transcription factor DksA
VASKAQVKKVSAAPKPVVKTIAKTAPKPAPKPIAKTAIKKPTPKAPLTKRAMPKPPQPAPQAVPAKKTSAASKTKTKAPHSVSAPSSSERVLAQQFIKKPLSNKNLQLTPFLTRQRQRLLELKDTLLDSMTGVARGNLHAGSETSAFGMHQADAGSDAYDRDFALSMLSKEQGSLYEIDAALKRINDGSYGMCDICEKPIRHDRLEALPFTRYTVECQAELEKRQHHHSVRPHINSLFGLTEEETESEEEETTETS